MSKHTAPEMPAAALAVVPRSDRPVVTLADGISKTNPARNTADVEPAGWVAPLHVPNPPARAPLPNARPLRPAGKRLPGEALQTDDATPSEATQPTPMAAVPDLPSDAAGQDTVLAANTSSAAVPEMASNPTVAAATNAAPARAASGESAIPPTPAGTPSYLSPLPSSAPGFLQNLFGAAPVGAIASGAVFVAAALPKDSGSGAAKDTVAPILVSANTSGDGSKIILKYSEALGTNVPGVANFSVLGDGLAQTISTVTRGTDGQSVELKLGSAVSSVASLQVSYQSTPGSSPIADTAGNAAATLTNQAVAQVDSVQPTLVSASAQTSSTNSVVLLKFSETLLASNLPAKSAFSVSVNGVLQDVSALDVGGNQVRLTLTNKIANAASVTVSVIYNAPAANASNTNAALQDPAGNDVAGFNTLSSSIAVAHTFDSSAATLLSASTWGNDGTQIKLSFGKDLDNSSLPLASAFGVETTTLANSTVAVKSVLVSGSNVFLTLAQPIANSSTPFRVFYTQPSGTDAPLQDPAGTDVASFVASSVANNIDSTGPTTNPLLWTFSSDKTLVLTYNETLGGIAADKSAFALVSNGASVAPSSLVLNTASKTITLGFDTAIQTGQATTLAYTPPSADSSKFNLAVQDIFGNDALTFPAQTVDTTAPTFVSAATSADGSQVILTLSEALSTNVPSTGADYGNFKVFDQNGVRSIKSVAFSGSTAVLTMTTALGINDKVNVSYIADSSLASIANSNASKVVIQDTTGNDFAGANSGSAAPTLASLAGAAVGNSIPFSYVSGQVLSDLSVGTNLFNQVSVTLNDNITGSLPDKAAFTLAVGGVAQTISSLSVSSGNSKVLVFGLASPLTLSGSDTSAAVTLGYTQPSTNPLTDVEGKTLANFSGQSLGTLQKTTSGTDTQSFTSGVDYIMGSAGNDSLTGAGGNDVFVWPSIADLGQAVQHITDFGFKNATGTSQGSAEADLLDISHLLTGYTAANKAQFLKFDRTADNKLQLLLDQNGGNTFAATATLVLDNVSVDTNNQLLVNGKTVVSTATALASANLSLSNVLDQLLFDNQMKVL